jgi:acyl-CoA synthetase (AMP-forming)/AMP-acid ligase II
MWQILKKLYQIKLLTFRGGLNLVKVLFRHGTNLMTLLDWVAMMQPNQVAIVDDDNRYTYQELQKTVEQLIAQLVTIGAIKRGQKVGLLCANHAALVQSLFAFSRIGADVYLLNPDMSVHQWQSLKRKVDFDVMVYDGEKSHLIDQDTNIQTISASTIEEWGNVPVIQPNRIPRINNSNVIILTGGTTGNFKLAARKPSLFTFLNPFFALLRALNLDKYQSLYVATPIYHGFGLSSVLIGAVLGAKMVMMKRFEATKAARLIEKEQVDVVTLVPLVLKRLLREQKCQLTSLKVILSGGAALSPVLVRATSRILGRGKLANLYGTTEAGFSVMASPDDLDKYPDTIGRAIKGVTLQIRNQTGKEVATNRVGDLCLKSRWTMSNKNEHWIQTGDLGYQNELGYYFLCGRVDDMVVSGGENVYPIELENLLLQHPHVAAVGVVGVEDEEYGQRLQAHIVLKSSAEQNATETLKLWLKKNAARHQQPKEIIIQEKLPYTAIGKLDRNKLRQC